MAEMRITVDNLCAMMKRGTRIVCTQGLPDDAVFAGWHIDEATNSLCVEFTHPTATGLPVRFADVRPQRKSKS